MKTYDVSLIGFGNVNRALAKIVTEQADDLALNYGIRFRIVAIADLFLGSLVSPNGIDARALEGIAFERGGFASLSGGSADADVERVICDVPADFVAEATFTNPEDGEPATTYCRLALTAGKNVVTTNKGPMTFAAAELKRLAKQNGVAFGFEGTVMSGTPVLRFVRETLPGAGLTGFQGILNGTSNYVLGRMSQGQSLAAAVKEAQELGYAEANPKADLAGYDVRLKVVILANELLRARLNPDQVTCDGIEQLTPELLAAAEAEGERWKLIGEASRAADGTVHASVAPKRLPLSHPLAGVADATNAITFQTEMLGPVSVVGPGAGRIETAFALLSDMLAIHRDVPTLARELAA